MIKIVIRGAVLAFLFTLLCLPILSQELKSEPAKSESQAPELNGPLPAGSKVYISPMVDGFDTFLTAGLQIKKVPLLLLTDKSKADFEITGIAASEKAGWAKMLFLGSQQSSEQASIKIVNLKTGAVVFGYAVNKGSSYRGKQSAAEACAKHIKEKIDASR